MISINGKVPLFVIFVCSLVLVTSGAFALPSSPVTATIAVSPETGSTTTTFTITATASSPNGIRNTSYYVYKSDGTLYKNKTCLSPLCKLMQKLPAGTYTAKAVAYDKKKNMAESNVISFTVSGPAPRTSSTGTPATTPPPAASPATAPSSTQPATPTAQQQGPYTSLLPSSLASKYDIMVSSFSSSLQSPMIFSKITSGRQQSAQITVRDKQTGQVFQMVVNNLTNQTVKKAIQQLAAMTMVKDSYIVELKEPSLLEVRKQKAQEIRAKEEELRETRRQLARAPSSAAQSQATTLETAISTKVTEMNNAVRAQKDKIQATRQQIKNTILATNTMTGAAVGSGLRTTIEKEFTKSFNGFSVKASKESIENIKKLDSVKKVYQNVVVFADLKESVYMIGAPDVWRLDVDGNNCVTSGKDCLTGKGIKIAIIDTGVDYTHPDLGGCLGAKCKVIGGYDIVNGDNDPMDDQGHGTHVAATAAGKDSQGVYSGVAPDAKIIAYKVLNLDGAGYEDWIISGIERAVDPNGDGNFDDRADIISMSLGGEGNPDDPMSQAVDRAVDNGIVAVIAAGNSGPSPQTINSPGTARKAITVGAVDKNENIADFSSRGPVISNEGEIVLKPDIVAPGVDICAAQYGTAFDYAKCTSSPNRVAISGTSMATPHVAGAVALIKQAHHDWTPDRIKTSLMNTARTLNSFNAYTQGSGLGLISIPKAMTSTVFATPEILDFGIADESSNSWSKAITITIQNTNNFDVTYTLNKENTNFIHQGPEVIVNSQLMFPQSVVVPASSTGTVSITLSVDTLIGNGLYSNNIIFSPDKAGENQIKLPVMFNQIKLPVMFIKVDPKLTINHPFTHNSVEIDASIEYAPTFFMLEVTQPDGSKISLPSEQLSSTAWRTTFQPSGPEGTYSVKATAYYGTAKVYSTASFVFDRTSPQLTSALDSDRNVILTANEDIAPHTSGLDTMLHSGDSNIWYDTGIIQEGTSSIISREGSNPLVVDSEMNVEPWGGGWWGLLGNRIAVYSYNLQSNALTPFAATDFTSSFGQYYTGYNVIIDKNNNNYLILANLTVKAPFTTQEEWQGYYANMYLMKKSSGSTELTPLTLLRSTNVVIPFSGIMSIRTLKDASKNDVDVFWIEKGVDKSIQEWYFDKVRYKKIDFVGNVITDTKLISSDEDLSILAYTIDKDSKGNIYVFWADYIFLSDTKLQLRSFYRKLNVRSGEWEDAVQISKIVVNNPWNIDESSTAIKKLITNVRFDKDDTPYVSYFDESFLTYIGRFDFNTNNVISSSYLSYYNVLPLMDIDATYNRYTAYGENGPSLMVRYDKIKNSMETVIIDQSDWYTFKYPTSIKNDKSSEHILLFYLAKCYPEKFWCDNVHDLQYNIYAFPSALQDDIQLPVTYEGSNRYKIYTDGNSNGIVITASDLAGNDARTSIDPFCGDGIVRTGVEQCDDGNANTNDACTNSCTNARCGDGIIRTGVEACDDGNTVNGDGCSATCRIDGACTDSDGGNNIYVRGTVRIGP